MGDTRKHFIPAAGHDWFLPLYDPILRLLGEESIKRELVDQAGVESGHRVLDIGCGTGTLSVLIKRLHPGAQVLGLDPDLRALARARRKSEDAGLSVHFDRGFSNELPYPDAFFDRVFSSLMFHHLERDQKLATLHEVARVLKPGASLHLLDFGRPRSWMDTALMHVLHRGEKLRENVEGRIPVLMEDTGFARPEEVAHRRTILGRLAFYRASRPTAVPD